MSPLRWRTVAQFPPEGMMFGTGGGDQCKMQRPALFGDEHMHTFFRRLAWSPDGAGLAAAKKWMSLLGPSMMAQVLAHGFCHELIEH